VTPILSIAGLTKEFGEVRALDELNLELEHGAVHGLVGPNGAGKTTLLSILVGLRQKTHGNIQYGVSENRVTLLPDTPDFFPFLTTREVVDLARYPFRDRVDVGTIDKVIAEVGLEEAADRRVGGFSRGMKQRLGLATVLISEPQLLLLDEPCSALDPFGRREVLNLVSGLKRKTTVLFSTHILGDVESVCDSMTVMNNGRMLYDGSIDTFNDSREQSFEDSILELLTIDSNNSLVEKQGY
jgi:ABC-2 type transport system ATP-binding protein